MPLTASQHAEIIKTHWPLLWPLPTARRMQVLDDLIADHEQEDELRTITAAMSSDPALRPAKELDFSDLEF